MAIGGVETQIGLTGSDVNLSEDPISALAGEQAPAQGGFDPLVSQRNEQSRIRNASRVRLTPLNAGYGWGLQNSDFYGNIPDRPAQYNTTRVGPYGGDTFFVPSSTRIPFTVLASRLQGVAQEKQQLKAQQQKLAQEFDPWSKIPELQASPYRENYEQWAMGGLENTINQAVSDYGGDASAAYAYLNSAEGRQKYGLDRKMKNIATVAHNADKVFADAQAYITEAETGQILVDEERLKLANDILKATTSTGTDAQQLAKKFEDWQTHQSIDQAWQTSGMEDKLLARIQASDPKAQWVNGALVVTMDHTSDYEEAADSFAEEWLPHYKGTNVTRDQLKKYALGQMPKAVKREMEVRFPPAQRAASAADQPKVWVGSVESGMVPAAGAQSGQEKQGGNKVEKMPIGEVVSGRRQNMGPRSFVNAGGKTVSVLPRYIVRTSDGQFYVTGQDAGDITTQTELTDLQSIVDNPEVSVEEKSKAQDKMVRITERSKEVRIPVKGNESALDQYLEGADWRNGFQGQTPATRQNDPLGIR